jgi:hypothetical protein
VPTTQDVGTMAMLSASGEIILQANAKILAETVPARRSAGRLRAQQVRHRRLL